MGRLDKLRRMKAAVVESDVFLAAQATEAARIAREVASAGASEAKLTNKDGDLTKLRAGRAAVRPVSTGRRLLRGAAKESLRQVRASQDNTTRETGGPARPPF